ncbi:hypothetical protein Tco_1382217 [Tanacetum coccineum]
MEPNAAKGDDHSITVEIDEEVKEESEECDEETKEEEEDDPENINTNPPSPPDPSISFIIKKVYKLNSNNKKNDDSSEKELGEDEGNFTYVSDFMIVDDISSIIDSRLSQVVLGKPFVEISNMTHDISLGVVKFTDRTNEIAYTMPHKIEQYNLLSNLEKGYAKSVYLRNEEDKRRGIDYVMSKILGFYKECLELRPEYLARLEDQGGVT